MKEHSFVPDVGARRKSNIVDRSGRQRQAEVCSVCGYSRIAVYDAGQGNLLVGDLWRETLWDDFALWLPEPNCPPSAAWLAARDMLVEMNASHEAIASSRQVTRACMTWHRKTSSRARLLCDALSGEGRE